MITHQNHVPNREAGIDFIHTGHEHADGSVDTDRATIMLDQAANAALCRLEAGWLQIMIDHRLDKHDPEIQEKLFRATALGAGIDYDELPKSLRSVSRDRVYKHINNLHSLADSLEAYSDSNLRQP